MEVLLPQVLWTTPVAETFVQVQGQKFISLDFAVFSQIRKTSKGTSIPVDFLQPLRTAS